MVVMKRIVLYLVLSIITLMLFASILEIPLLLGDINYMQGNFHEAYKNYYRYRGMHDGDDPFIDSRIYFTEIELKDDQGKIEQNFPEEKSVAFVPNKPEPSGKNLDPELSNCSHMELTEEQTKSRRIEEELNRAMKYSKALQSLLVIKKIDFPYVYYEPSKMNLYDYLHNDKTLSDDFDKDDDDIKYYQSSIMKIEENYNPEEVEKNVKDNQVLLSGFSILLEKYQEFKELYKDFNHMFSEYENFNQSFISQLKAKQVQSIGISKKISNFVSLSKDAMIRENYNKTYTDKNKFISLMKIKYYNSIMVWNHMNQKLLRICILPVKLLTSMPLQAVLTYRLHFQRLMQPLRPFFLLRNQWHK